MRMLFPLLLTLVVGIGINRVIPLSGCSAFLNALVASGLVVQPFIFIGFLPSSENDRKKKLVEYAHYPMTLVFYEAPHRIAKTLRDMQEVLGDRRCVIARELTKLHEEFLRGTISQLLEAADDLKGEMVIVMEGCSQEKETYADETLVKMVEEAVQSGISRSKAVKDVANKTGVSKNRIYALVHGG